MSPRWVGALDRLTGPLTIEAGLHESVILVLLTKAGQVMDLRPRLVLCMCPSTLYVCNADRIFQPNLIRWFPFPTHNQIIDFHIQFPYHFCDYYLQNSVEYAEGRPAPTTANSNDGRTL